MSDYLKVVDNAAPRTLIIFSPARIRAGRFSGIKAFTDESNNYIFVNCPNNTWYLNAIPGLGSEPDAVALRLKQEVDALGGDQLVTYGGSMGGYGAALYGAMLEADHCVTTGVEVVLGTEGAFFNKLCTEVVPHERKALLGKLLLQSEGTRFHFFYGEQCAHDLLGALELPQKPNIKVHTILNEGHAIPSLLDHLFNMQTFVDICCQEQTDVPWASMLGSMMQYPEAIKLLHEYDELGVRGEDLEMRLSVLLEGLDPVSASPFLFKRSVMKKGRKDFEGALADLEAALKHNPDYYQARCNAAHMLLALGRVGEALEYARSLQGYIIERIRPFYHARYTLVRCLARNGLVEEARAELAPLKSKFERLAADSQHRVQVANLERMIDNIEKRQK